MTYLDQINSMARPETEDEKTFREAIKRQIKEIQSQVLWGNNVKKELKGYVFMHSCWSARIADIVCSGTYSGSPILRDYYTEDESVPPNKYLKDYATIDDAQRALNGFRRILTDLGFQGFTIRIDKVWLETSIPDDNARYGLRRNTRVPKAVYIIYVHATW